MLEDVSRLSVHSVNKIQSSESTDQSDECCKNANCAGLKI
jgi:hypothetical protein